MKGKTRIMAECRDCDWKTENYIKHRILAAEHAKKFKHKVSVKKGSRISLTFMILGFLFTIIGLLCFLFLCFLKFMGQF